MSEYGPPKLRSTFKLTRSELDRADPAQIDTVGAMKEALTDEIWAQEREILLSDLETSPAADDLRAARDFFRKSQAVSAQIERKFGYKLTSKGRAMLIHLCGPPRHMMAATRVGRRYGRPIKEKD